MAQNGKILCLSHFISQEPYIIWLWFLVHMCKMIYPAIFSFFKILIFGVFREIKGKKMTWIYQFQFVLLYISGTVDCIIEILIMISTGVFSHFFKSAAGLILATYCVWYLHIVPFLRNKMPYSLLKTPKAHVV